MGALETFEHALAERIFNDKDKWYDGGLIAVGKLASQLRIS